MTPLDLAKAYLAKGREDEAALEALLENSQISDGIFGFHAQQAAEKYLKAVLAIGEERPQKTHDLHLLADQCERLGHPLPDELHSSLELSPFAVRERYPFASMPPLDRELVQQGIRALRKWVSGLLSET